MKGLTAKEEEIMGLFWRKGPLFMKEILVFYEEPKPYFNTLSTIVRELEKKGFLNHNTFGSTYQYYAMVSVEDFKKGTLKNTTSKYSSNPYLSTVSSLVNEEEFSPDDLKRLIQGVERGKLPEQQPSIRILL